MQGSGIPCRAQALIKQDIGATCLWRRTTYAHARAAKNLTGHNIAFPHIGNGPPDPAFMREGQRQTGGLTRKPGFVFMREDGEMQFVALGRSGRGCTPATPINRPCWRTANMPTPSRPHVMRSVIMSRSLRTRLRTPPASRPVTVALALSRTISSRSPQETGSSCNRPVCMRYLPPMAASVTAGITTCGY